MIHDDALLKEWSAVRVSDAWIDGMYDNAVRLQKHFLEVLMDPTFHDPTLVPLYVRGVSDMMDLRDFWGRVSKARAEIHAA